MITSESQWKFVQSYTHHALTGISELGSPYLDNTSFYICLQLWPFVNLSSSPILLKQIGSNLNYPRRRLHEFSLYVQNIEMREHIRCERTSRNVLLRRKNDGRSGNGQEWAKWREHFNIIPNIIEYVEPRSVARPDIYLDGNDGSFDPDNLAKELTTASTREVRPPSELPFVKAPGTSRFPPVELLTTAGYPPDMVTRTTWTSHWRPPELQHTDVDTDDETVLQDRNRWAEYSRTSDVTEQCENIIGAMTMLPHRLQATNTNHKLLHALVPTFRWNKGRFNEFEHLLRNHLRPFSNRLTEEMKLQLFQTLLPEEAIEFFQSLTISTDTMLTEVLAKFRKELTKDDLKDLARYKWDQAKYDPTVKTFLDFLKRLKVIAKQSFQDDAAKFI